MTQDIKEVYAVRIRNAIRVLEHKSEWVKAGVTNFDINEWYGDYGTECGTTACAAGLLASHPAFKAVGFKIQRYSWDGHRRRGHPVYKGCIEFEAVAKFFGFPYPVNEEGPADLIFSGDGYGYKFPVTPQMVANKLRAYLKEHGAKLPSRSLGAK